MSKKLLEESTIRSFMKLANLEPLSQKFISENYGMKEEEHDEEDEDSDGDDAETRQALEELNKALEEEEGLEEEVLDEDMAEGDEGDGMSEAREGGDKTPSSPRPKVKGVTKATKMKGGHADHKMTAAKTGGSHHTSNTDTISTKNHSKPRTKNNSQFDIVAESLEEQDEAPPEGEDPAAGAEGTPSDTAGEGGDHQGKMKDLIRQMLGNLKDMGAEYGMTMEVSDEGAGGEEAAPPEGEEAPPEGEEPPMQENLNKVVDRLTQRVAARLVKESKKRR